MANLWDDRAKPILHRKDLQCEELRPEDLLKTAFYNVGAQKQELRRQSKKSKEHMKELAQDIEEAVSECGVVLLCLCELG